MALRLRREGDEIDGVIGVELVDFILTIDDRHIPFQGIDEDLLAVTVHRFQRRAEFRAIVGRDQVDHDGLSGD